MKKIYFILTLIIALTFFQSLVFAGDSPESITYTDSKADVLIGTVVGVDDNSTTIQVSEFLFEEFTDSEVVINELIYDDVQVGDYCAVAVYKENEEFLLYENLAGKTDSLDKKTLKIDSDNDLIKRFNGYINDGTYAKEKRGAPINHAQPVEESSNNSRIYKIIVVGCIIAEAINLSYFQKKRQKKYEEEMKQNEEEEDN